MPNQIYKNKNAKLNMRKLNPKPNIQKSKTKSTNNGLQGSLKKGGTLYYSELLNTVARIDAFG